MNKKCPIFFVLSATLFSVLILVNCGGSPSNTESTLASQENTISEGERKDTIIVDEIVIVDQNEGDIVSPLSVNSENVVLDSSTREYPISVSGGMRPYTFSLGSSPKGSIAMDGDRGIYTAPLAGGNDTVTVRDSKGASVTVRISSKNSQTQIILDDLVTPSPLVMNPSQVTLVSGRYLTEFFQFNPSGGTTPYTFSISSSSPLHLGSIDAKGGFRSYTRSPNGMDPTSDLDSSVALIIRDSANPPASVTATIHIVAPLTLKHTISIPQRETIRPIVMVNSVIHFLASGGHAPYQFSVSQGAGTIDINTGVFRASQTPVQDAFVSVKDQDDRQYKISFHIVKIQEIQLGYLHSCSLLNNGTVKCWGWNQYGQLGIGNTINSLTPAQVITSNVKQIQLGSLHSCALLNDGTVKCWGNNTHGQLGSNGEMGVSPNLTQVKEIQVASGSNHSCALLNDETVKCWGENNYGQLGDGTTINRFEPVLVKLSDKEFLNNVKEIQLGTAHSCALLNDGTVKCWGYNRYGQLGIVGSAANSAALVNSSTPVSVKADINNMILSNVKEIQLGADHSCALLNDGTVKCWGRNYSGQLGNGTTGNSLTPIPVTGLSDVKEIQLGTAHSCALLNDDTTVKCWGLNDQGQLGNGNNSDRSTPSDIQW